MNSKQYCAPKDALTCISAAGSTPTHLRKPKKKPHFNEGADEAESQHCQMCDVRSGEMATTPVVVNVRIATFKRQSLRPH
eukprot:5734944-Amphidinium_carterae.1